mgnify:FL=1
MTSITNESAEELRLILQKTQGRRFDISEARRIGSWLLKLYDHLDYKEGTSLTQDRKKKKKTDTNTKLTK